MVTMVHHRPWPQPNCKSMLFARSRPGYPYWPYGSGDSSGPWGWAGHGPEMPSLRGSSQANPA